MAHSVEAKADTSHEHVLASLAEETKKLLKKDTTVFSSVLSKWHPQSAVVSASLLHKLYGSKLVSYVRHSYLKCLYIHHHRILNACMTFVPETVS